MLSLTSGGPASSTRTGTAGSPVRRVASMHPAGMVAPVGVQAVVHPDGELASARAAASVGVPMIHSTAASNSIEDVAAALGDTPRWFQLYWPNDPELAASFVRRAEAAGYGA